MSDCIEYNCFYSLVYGLIYAVVFVYDVFTFPLYLLIQNPVKTYKLSKLKRAVVCDKGSGYITYKTTKKPYEAHQEINQQGIKTMTELFEYAAKKHTEKRCLGTRVILGEQDEVQSNGRVFKKYVLGDYKWFTYTEVDRLAQNFGKGLGELGNQPRQPIAILAETQAKWMIAAHGAFKSNFPLVTIYATLGDDAITHALNETEVNIVITSFALLPKFKNILPNTPHVKTIVYMEDQLHSFEGNNGYKEDVNIIAFDDVVSLGAKSHLPENRPTQDDLAIIMYTSGSTGVPKGVKLLHSNLISATKSFCDCTQMYKNDVVLGYLPLAHVFELLVENGCTFMGLRIGYSSALTMIDTASKVQKGTKGDASILKPTFNSTVPVILDRISKAIKEKVDKSSGFKKVLFKFGYNYKKRWINRGFKTPITDKIIFQATRGIMGGNMRAMAAGGAPLTADTQEFVNICLCVRILQGYGLTETTSCCSNQDMYDMLFGRVGPPMTTVLVRVVNWEEGNYFITDKPNPRGEIVIGGDVVSPGYYKNDEKTKEEFFEDKGVHWFRTGDIGEIQKDGSIKIIDRKKDLVKLQAGEYVSLGKIESLLTTHSLIENICVYAESTKSYCVALIVPNRDNLQRFAIEKLNNNKNFEELCDDNDVVKAVQGEIVQYCKKVKLEKFEIPERIKLVKEIWLPETGLVTATLKLKRKEIQNFYRRDLELLYS